MSQILSLTRRHSSSKRLSLASRIGVHQVSRFRFKLAASNSAQGDGDQEGRQRSLALSLARSLVMRRRIDGGRETVPLMSESRKKTERWSWAQMRNKQRAFRLPWPFPRPLRLSGSPWAEENGHARSRVTVLLFHAVLVLRRRRRAAAFSSSQSFFLSSLPSSSVLPPCELTPSSLFCAFLGKKERGALKSSSLIPVPT